MDGSFDMTTNLRVVTDILVREYGLRLDGRRQDLMGEVVIYPMEAFIAKDHRTGWILRDESTYAIHHYAASWIDDKQRRREDVYRQYLRTYIRAVQPFLSKYASIRTSYELDGILGVMEKIKKYISK